MIEAILVWGIASWVFVKFFNYPIEYAMNAFYVMAGFGLIIFDRKRMRARASKALKNMKDSLEESGYIKKKES